MKDLMTTIPELTDKEVNEVKHSTEAGTLKFMHTKRQYRRATRHGELLGSWRNGMVWLWRGAVWYYHPYLCK